MKAHNIFRDNKDSNHFIKKNDMVSSKEIPTDKDCLTEQLLNKEKLLEAVIKGIPGVVIKVYKTDNTIAFFNQAGYDFYGKTPNEVQGKKCYKVLGRKDKCTDCIFDKALETKKIVNMEKYIPEINKYMDCCCNPVLDDSGNVIFVVEQLRDITNKRVLEKKLKESEERYRQIVDLSPEAIIIILDNKIVLANGEAYKLMNIDLNKPGGENIYKYVHPDFIKILHKRIKRILRYKTTNVKYECKLINENTEIDAEISSSYLTYNGEPAVQSIIRNVTEMRGDLNKAAKIQKKWLQDTFPIPNKARMESIYVPSKTVGGDSYKLYKVSDDLVIGVIWDVSGKGITAALSISAFNVLLNDSILASNDPSEIMHSLNTKIADFLDDTYIAACCFSINFREKKAKVVSAGINEFVFEKLQYKPEKKIVKGPFLGMFKDSTFDEYSIHFRPGDKFYFYTDGLDFIFCDDALNEYFVSTNSIHEFKKYLNSYLNEMITDIKDDCTMLLLEIIQGDD
ncbi:MAG: SpoIIE family protein phosphatase [Bacillota bacterium]|nr:SpoIIE family protein phosphatase [Bacillota bacterium]